MEKTTEQYSSTLQPFDVDGPRRILRWRPCDSWLLRGLCLASLGLPGMDAAALTMLPWDSGRLSQFFATYADAGISNPVLPPFGIVITGNVAHVADTALTNGSEIIAYGGTLVLQGGITNTSMGSFTFSGLTHIQAAPGSSATAGFTNEGFMRVNVGPQLHIQVPFHNTQGGVVHVPAGTTLSARDAFIDDNSLFQGTGTAVLTGTFSGRVTSEGSVWVTGDSTGNFAEIDGAWILGGSFPTRLFGTWTNHGTLRARPGDALGGLGALGPGAQFVNEGTIRASTMTLYGTIDASPPSGWTRLTNNGLIDLRSTTFITHPMQAIKGNFPVIVENNGILHFSTGLTNFQLDNSGTIDASGGSYGILGHNSAGLSDVGATFRGGTRLIGTLNGIQQLPGLRLQDQSGGPAQTHFDFSGPITIENLGFWSRGQYRSEGAVLLGHGIWANGDFTGGWANFGTLSTHSLSTPLPQGPGIQDEFVNFGIINWRDILQLRSGASVINQGLFSYTRSSSSGSGWLLGATEGVKAAFFNAGSFTVNHVGSGSSNVLVENIRFTNVGTVNVEQGATLTLRNSPFENAGVIDSSGNIIIEDSLGGRFTNSGRIESSRQFQLESGVHLVSEGEFVMRGLPRNSIGQLQTRLRGRAGGVRETFVNDGRFLVLNPEQSTILDLDFVNNGVLELQDGATLALTASATLQNTGTIMGNGTLAFAGLWVNQGTIAPGLSPGTLIIDGAFENGQDGVLELEIASASVFDVLEFRGSRAPVLGGTLRIKLLDGFVPTVGDTFSLLSFASLNGAFAHVELSGLDGAEFSFAYSPSDFQFTFTAVPTPVPLPSAYALMLIALPLLRRRARYPAQ